MNQLIDWTELEPFGARVQLDLSQPLSDRQAEAIRQLFDERHLLVFAGQRLSWDDQACLASLFGPAIEQSPSSLAPDPSEGGLGQEALPFHSDLACASEPILAICLYALDVDAHAPPTLFVDAMAAAASLPEELRRRIDGLHAMNLWPRSLSRRQRADEAPEGWPGTAHPVLRNHPRSGEQFITLNASHTDRIVELAPTQSEELVQELFAQLYARGGGYEHHWREGDLVVWDNLALQHSRTAIADGVRRTLQRVTVGSASFMEEMPPELLGAYNAE